ncbi:MAG: hypothetical protein ACI9W2_005344 [Gammaproteobacteria bacterium]|jgi:hypothetical protein
MASPVNYIAHGVGKTTSEFVERKQMLESVCVFGSGYLQGYDIDLPDRITDLVRHVMAQSGVILGYRADDELVILL